MKKYKMINFIDQNKNYSIPTKSIILLTIVVVIQVIINLSNMINYKKELANFIELNPKTRKVEETEEYLNINVKNISELYTKLDRNKVNKISLTRNGLNIEGTCNSLGEIQGVKEVSYIKDMSIEGIQKEENIYKYNIYCEIGGK